MQKLDEKAMLVKASISQWSARRHDKEATKTVEDKYNAVGVGRFNKVLMESAILKAINKKANEIRSFHYENTLPWNDEGWRIMPAKNFQYYSQKMRVHESEITSLFDAFSMSFNTLLNDAKLKLNGLFNPTDYPESVRDHFDFKVSVKPLPVGDDFRVDLPEAERTRIRNEINSETAQGLKAGHADLYKRLYEGIKHMAEKLSDSKSVFRDSLVNNLCEFCEMIPRLDMMDDPELEKIRREAEEKLCQFPAQTLRDKKIIRQDVANDAKTILDAMGALYDQQN